MLVPLDLSVDDERDGLSHKFITCRYSHCVDPALYEPSPRMVRSSVRAPQVTGFVRPKGTGQRRGSQIHLARAEGAGSTVCGFGTALLDDITLTFQALFIFPGWVGGVSVVLLIRPRPIRPA
ncbi:MAG: hypothetical protein U9N78_05585 [Actinomycetota bacterium]|nr:hypothetical protein [Actinomycetota bacterium]